jgi:CRP-like cAMP-binding protein
MEISERFPQMMKADILSDLPKKFRKEFIDRCTVINYDSPTHILVQGEQSPGMFLIASGNVEILYLGEDGQQTFFARAGVGSIVGEVEAITEQLCAATAEAMANTTLLFCSKGLLLEALGSVEFVKNLMKVFHGHLLQLNYFKLVDRNSPVDHRLCAYLLMFSERNSTIYDSQSYLAGVVGCSRQTINKELGALRDKGFISVEKGVIEILDREKLEAFLSV